MTTSERIRSLRSVVVPESGCLPRVCLQREEFFSKSAGRPSTAATTVSVRIAAQLQPSGYIRYKRPVSTCCKQARAGGRSTDQCQRSTHSIFSLGEDLILAFLERAYGIDSRCASSGNPRCDQACADPQNESEHKNRRI